jgi:hypothetical protein
MGWDFFTTGPGIALIAAVASFVAGLFGPTITSRTMSKTHSQRLAAEGKLAERRFEFDKELSQHKSDADIALAEKKFQLDARLADRKRRQDLAEEVLESFYKIRDVVRSIRVPFISEGAGASRKPTEPESNTVAYQRDRYYATLVRMDEHQSEIASLLAKRYRTAAWFGSAADEPFKDIHETLTQMGIAVHQLINGVSDAKGVQGPLAEKSSATEFFTQLEYIIWAVFPDDPVSVVR